LYTISNTRKDICRKHLDTGTIIWHNIPRLYLATRVTQDDYEGKESRSYNYATFHSIYLSELSG